MGNAWAISTVSKIVTLGGRRQCDNARKRPLKMKTTLEKRSKKIEQKKPKQKLKSTKKLSSKTKQNVVKTRGVSDTKPSNLIFNKIKDENETKQLSSNEKPTDFQEKLNDIKENAQAQPQQDFFQDRISTDFTSSCCSSRVNLCLSSKYLHREKFKTEWQREEKRLQIECQNAEQRIRNSQLDEERAKLEVQAWREKLEKLTAEHRKYLFTQAQSINSRLHNAEKLLTYHEVRAKKLQIKNDTMKELINCVKEEAHNLRIESEKRREVTHKIFDEKFSTVEKRLTKLKQKLGQTKSAALPPKKRNQIAAGPGERLNYPSTINSSGERFKNPVYYSRHFYPNKCIGRSKECFKDLKTGSTLHIPFQLPDSLSSSVPSYRRDTVKPNNTKINCSCKSTYLASTKNTPTSSPLLEINRKNFSKHSVDVHTAELQSNQKLRKVFEVSNRTQKSTDSKSPKDTSGSSSTLNCFDKMSVVRSGNSNSHRSRSQLNSTNSDRSDFVSSSGSSILMKLFGLAESERSSRTSKQSIKFLNNK